MMFGAYPFASIPFASSLTDASSIPSITDLIADQESPRAYLFHATPYDSVGADEVDVYASIGLAYPILDSNHYPAILKTAVDSQVDLFGENEDSQGRTSFGNLELMIGDSEHDDLVDYLWDGRSVEVLLGAEGFDIDEYVRVLYGTAEDITYDQRKLSVVFRGKEALLDKPVQETLYAGSGGLEGGTDLEDSPKPLTFGLVENLTPVLVDRTNLIYQCNDGPINAVFEVYDGGSPLTNVGDIADITAATVPAGYYRTQITGGYIRLGAAPEKALTMDVEGATTGGYAETAPDIIYRLCISHTDLAEADLNMWSFFTARLDSRRATCGVYITGQTVQSVINELMASIGGAWTFNREGLLTLGVFRLRKSVGTITENDIVKGSFRREKTAPPSWQRKIGYGKSWTVQKDDQFLGATEDDQKEFASTEYRYAVSEDSDIKTPHAGARIVEKNTLINGEAQATAESVRQQSLFGESSDRFNLIAKRQQFKYNVGETITIDYPRFDFPQDMLVLGIRENTSTRQTTFRLWG